MKTLAALVLVAAACVSCKSEPGVARSQEEIDQILQKGATGMGKPPAAPGTAAPGSQGAAPPMPAGMTPPGG